MLNLPDSITDTPLARTMVYYNAYTEAKSVKLLRKRSGPERDHDSGEDDGPNDPLARRTGVAKVRAGDEEKTKKLLGFSGETYGGVSTSPSVCSSSTN